MITDHIEISGVRTFYAKSGDSGLPVVLMHGSSPGACTEVSWSKNIDEIAASGVTVYAFDQPGFGQSDHPSDFSLEFRIEHGKAFLDHFGLRRPILVGNSMGGYMAARIASDDQDAAGLVLVSTVPLTTPNNPDPASGEEAHTRVLGAFEPGLENMRTLTSGTIFDPSKVTEELVQLRHEMSSGAHHEAQQKMRAACTKRREDVPMESLPANTLIIWGGQDGSVAMERAVPLCLALPGSRLHVFNSCGHWPQWEYPVEFNGLISQFAERCGAGQ